MTAKTLSGKWKEHLRGLLSFFSLTLNSKSISECSAFWLVVEYLLNWSASRSTVFNLKKKILLGTGSDPHWTGHGFTCLAFIILENNHVSVLHVNTFYSHWIHSHGHHGSPEFALASSLCCVVTSFPQMQLWVLVLHNTSSPRCISPQHLQQSIA